MICCHRVGCFSMVLHSKSSFLLPPHLNQSFISKNNLSTPKVITSCRKGLFSFVLCDLQIIGWLNCRDVIVSSPFTSEADIKFTFKIISCEVPLNNVCCCYSLSMSSARHSSHTVLIFIFQTIILFLVKMEHKLDMCLLIFYVIW